jgi:hypothetical protein
MRIPKFDLCIVLEGAIKDTDLQVLNFLSNESRTHRFCVVTKKCDGEVRYVCATQS